MYLKQYFYPNEQIIILKVQFFYPEEKNMIYLFI